MCSALWSTFGRIKSRFGSLLQGAKLLVGCGRRTCCNRPSQRQVEGVISVSMDGWCWSEKVKMKNSNGKRSLVFFFPFSSRTRRALEFGRRLTS